MGFNMAFPRLALRIVQGVLSVIVVVLSAYVAHWYNTDVPTPSPPQINFLIFAGLYSMLSVVFLEAVPKFFARVSNPYTFLAVEALNVIVWFSGAVALAVFMGKLAFCRGSVCGAAQADAVFSFALFLSWNATALFLARDVFKSG
ncbi:marvel domain-containing protein, partial [Lasiosphaeris hirsuta]